VPAHHGAKTHDLLKMVMPARITRYARPRSNRECELEPVRSNSLYRVSRAACGYGYPPLGVATWNASIPTSSRCWNVGVRILATVQNPQCGRRDHVVATPVLQRRRVRQKGFL